MVSKSDVQNISAFWISAKENYRKPVVKIVEITPRSMIAASLDQPDDNGDE